MSSVNYTHFIYGGLFMFIASVFLIHYVVSGQAVYGDGIGYYSHLHNWIIDQDLDSTNEYKHNYNPENNNSLNPQVKEVQIVRTNSQGKALNHFSPGPAILLTPFYLITHALSLLLSSLGVSVPTTGYSDIYQITTGIGALIYTVVGVYLLEKVISKITTSATIARMSVLSIFFGSQLLYYGSYDVINSHFASFFLTVLWLYIVTHTKPKNNAWLLGIIAGLMVATRPQDGCIILVWLLATNINIPALAKFSFGFLFGSLPLIIHWLTVFNGVREQTYIKEIQRIISTPQSIDWLGSLFHPINGLFIPTPLLLAVGLYLLLKFRYQHQLTKMFSLFFLCQYFIITIQSGWSAAAYGGRMYISSLPLFALGLSHCITHTRKKILIPSLALLIMINIVSILRFIVTKKTIDKGTGFEPATQQRMERIINKIF